MSIEVPAEKKVLNNTMNRAYAASKLPVIYTGGPTWESYNALKGAAALGLDGLHSVESIANAAGITKDQAIQVLRVMRANMLFRMRRIRGTLYYGINMLGRDLLAKCNRHIERCS